MGGFMGKYLVVNLSGKTSETIAPGEEFYKKYLSGYGLGAAVIAERQTAGIDPLSPESHLGFCSGFLTGTGLPFTGRFMVVGKSPLTHGWGDANSGGFLSREIKRTGIDAVFFTGKATSPIWVHITDEGVEFKEASGLWGKDINETEDAIKSQLNNKKVQVATIGVAGEKCSLISGIATDGGRIAARSGLGAIMGSKKLKAVSFFGKNDIPVFDKEKVKALSQQFVRNFKKEPPLKDLLAVRFISFVAKLVAKTGMRTPASQGIVKKIYGTWGTPGLTLYSGLTGDTPVKNWGGSAGVDFTFNQLQKISGDKVISRQKRRYACQSCPMGCGGIVDIKAGRYKGTEGHKPEYETLGVFGAMLLNDDLDSIFELNEMCNRAGIDTISTGSAVAFAIECLENGVIDRDALGGLDLGWGKTKEIIKLTEMIINREGIGDVLADGVKKAAEAIGKNSERFAMHAGGQEMGMHDSRMDPGWAAAYQCDPTPGRHTVTSYVDSDLRSGKEQFPEIKRMVEQASTEDLKRLRLTAATGIYTQLVGACGVCLFAPDIGAFPMVDFLNAVTGWKMSADEYFKTGKRILTLRKAFSAREGVRPKDTKLPPRAIGLPALRTGPLKGRAVDIDTLEKEYYATMGWDLAIGGPTPETLKEMEIDHLMT
jgi:aldehyde:ferredoxin oxidoreductase